VVDFQDGVSVEELESNLSDTHRKYLPVGFCIYCGASASSVLLEDEHVVPYGLGGTLVLPKSSCRECAAITGKIEQECLRKILGDLRTWRKVRRRKRKIKDSFRPLPMLVDVDGKTQEFAATQPEERLDVTALHAFYMPALITGILTPDYPAMWVQAALGKNLHKAVGEKYERATRVQTQSRFHPELFAKMLAKIGHSFAVAEANGKFRPLLGRAIIGKEPWRSGYYVGGDPNWWPKSEYLNEVSLQQMTGADGKTYCVAQIRLFGDLGAPVYYVVVGEAEPVM
jgi:hypothetical protein